jgi:hypothetical protein
VLSPILRDLVESDPLRRYGYRVLRHDGPSQEFQDLRERLAALLSARLQDFSGRPVPRFALEDYAAVAEGLGLDHGAFLRATRRHLPADLLRHPHLRRLVERAGQAVGRELRVFRDVLEYRVCRPHRPDYNPWHRDSWFPDFDVLLNVYLPLSGSHVDSALQVVPGSHLWTHEECVPSFEFDARHYDRGTTRKAGVSFNVPEVAECRHELRGHRPDVLPGDFMIFATQTVHGSGSNASPETRFSFEFRLEAAPQSAARG